MHALCNISVVKSHLERLSRSGDWRYDSVDTTLWASFSASQGENNPTLHLSSWYLLFPSKSVISCEMHLAFVSRSI